MGTQEKILLEKENEACTEWIKKKCVMKTIILFMKITITTLFIVMVVNYGLFHMSLVFFFLFLH